jgi:DNA polymerase-4
VTRAGSAGGPPPILHVDLDAFYATAEQVLDPTLWGKPMAVGQGVVMAATYEARRFGVRSAMSTRVARKLCPTLIVVSGHFEEYGRMSEAVFDLCTEFTPNIEQISIDEAFIDTTGSTHLFGDSADIAAAMRKRVRQETGLILSVGVASTKFLAKVASRVAKPDGLLVIDPATELDFLHALPVSAIWGVGAATESRLAQLGIATVGELAATDTGTLRRHLGRSAGSHLHNLAWNRDPRRVTVGPRRKSVGAQSAFGRGGADSAVRRRVLTDLADRVGRRLRAKQFAGRTITARIRFDDMTAITRSATLVAPIATTPAIAELALRLAEDGIADVAAGRVVNLLGIAVSHLSVAPHLQLELPFDGATGDDLQRAGSQAELARHELDLAVDAIRKRFGTGAVGPASRVLGGRTGAVPDEFRDLQTRD